MALKKWTDNEAIEFMHNNISESFVKVANYAKKNNLDAQEIIDFLLEYSEIALAQAKVVKLRDELGLSSSFQQEKN